MKIRIVIYVTISLLIVLYLNSKLPYIFYNKITYLDKIELATNDKNCYSTKINLLKKSYYKILKNGLAIDKNVKVFICSNYQEFTFFSLYFNRNSLGLTKPLVRRIYLAPTGFAENTICSKSGSRRKLTSVIAHEITHIALDDKYGVIHNLFTPKWKIEGICEFVSEDSSMDIAEGLKYFVRNKNIDSPSYKYFTYRLCVDYLIKHKGYSIDKILTEDIDANELEKQIKSDIVQKYYIPEL